MATLTEMPHNLMYKTNQQHHSAKTNMGQNWSDKNSNNKNKARQGVAGG